MERLQSLLGIFVFLGIAWLLGGRAKQKSWKGIFLGVLGQGLLCAAFFHLPRLNRVLEGLNEVVLLLEKATQAGTSMVFGFLGGASLPFDESFPGASFVLAFKALPLVLTVSALSALLFHWRILPLFVGFISGILRKVFNISGALGFGVAANIFVGMVEAPIFVRPYLKDLSSSELFALMVTGMSTIAGTVMILYAQIIGPVVPGAFGHILVASVISAPAALTVAFLMALKDVSDMMAQ